MKILAWLTIALLLSSSALWAKKPNLSEETKALLKEAKAQSSGINAQALRKMMKEKKVVLIDVRDPDEWVKDSIEYEKELKISRGFLEIKYPEVILKHYTKEDTFVLYCALEPRSIFAAQRLSQLGFKHVFYLKGGLQQFKKYSGCKLPKRQPIASLK